MKSAYFITALLVAACAKTGSPSSQVADHTTQTRIDRTKALPQSTYLCAVENKYAASTLSLQQGRDYSILTTLTIRDGGAIEYRDRISMLFETNREGVRYSHIDYNALRHLNFAGPLADGTYGESIRGVYEPSNFAGNDWPASEMFCWNEYTFVTDDVYAKIAAIPAFQDLLEETAQTEDFEYHYGKDGVFLRGVKASRQGRHWDHAKPDFVLALNWQAGHLDCSVNFRVSHDLNSINTINRNGNELNIYCDD